MAIGDAGITGTGTYLLAIAVLTGLGGVALAGDLYARLLWRARVPVLHLYSAALAVAVLAGAPVVGLAGRAGARPWALLLCVPVGAAVGLLARAADRTVIRAITRRGPHTPTILDFLRGITGQISEESPRSPGRVPGRAPGAAPRKAPVRVTPSGGSLLLGGTARRVAGGHRGPDSGTATDPGQFPLAAVIAVAVCEELFYRGLLLRAALRAPGAALAATLVLASLVAFVLSHVTFGWRHVLAKAPLGVGTTASALLLSGPAAAVIAHVVFNVLVWRDIRAGAPGAGPRAGGAPGPANHGPSGTGGAGRWLR